MARKSRRRGRGEGSVFQRKDGRWVVQVELGDGKRKQFYVTSQSEGIKKLREVQHELEQGTLPTGPQQTVKQYLEFWLEEVHRPTIRVSTYVKYRVFVYKHFIPVLGHLRLQKLTPQHVQSLYRQKEKEGISTKTIQVMHGVLHKALDMAVRWSLVSRNVCDVVSPPRVARTERRLLSIEQVHHLLGVVRGHWLEVLLTMAVTLGMRRGEMLALRWADVDLKGRWVQVCRTVDYVTGHGYVETEPKTAAGRRVIALPFFVAGMLERHRDRQREARKQAGNAWQDRDLVFTNGRGGYVSPMYLLALFNKALAEAGLPHMRFHDLRHSAVTLLVGMGVPLKVVQEIVGHSDITMTADIYAHVLPAMQRDAMGRWDSAFGVGDE
jgi:integrase